MPQFSFPRLTGPDEVDVLAPLYRHLHEQHVGLAPRLGGILDARTWEDSWARRRRDYVSWLSEPGGFALVARGAGGADPAGYVVGSVEEGYAGWASSGDRVGVVRDLVVAPTQRGRGLGTALLVAAEAEFAGLGIGEYRLNVVAQNTGAIRLYERHGMAPVARVFLKRVGPGSAAPGD